MSLNWQSCTDNFCEVENCRAECDGREFEISFDGLYGEEGPNPYMLMTWDYKTPVDGEDPGYGVVIDERAFPSADMARMYAEHWMAIRLKEEATCPE